ncbi:MAG TPA: hypothetical protein VLA37_04080 [Sphingomonadaceae bacterium]|nr:hypothetical protein [Sphingomonadaceae bacterium]
MKGSLQRFALLDVETGTGSLEGLARRGQLDLPLFGIPLLRQACRQAQAQLARGAVKLEIAETIDAHGRQRWEGLRGRPIRK